MNKYATTTFLIVTVTLAGAASIFGPASFALVAGKNEISALSKSPNAAADWLSDNACDSIKRSVTGPVGFWLFLAGSLSSVLNSLAVYGLNHIYHRCVKKWPKLGSAPYDGSSSRLLMKCYHKLLPGREAVFLLAAFFATTLACTVAMVEFVANTMKGELEAGFTPGGYNCYHKSLTAPPFVNQIIRSMAGPVGKAARLAAYLPAAFFLLGSSLLTLGSTALVRFWQKSARENEGARSVAKRATYEAF